MMLDALTVPYAALPGEYGQREDVLNARVQDVKATLLGVVEDPRGDVAQTTEQLREWVTEWPVTFTPYAGATDEEWERPDEA